MKISPLAGKRCPSELLIDIPKLLKAYYQEIPNPALPAERIAFGTSGHRGSSLSRTFNEAHILCITQAVIDYRIQHSIAGPLFIGADTHALSAPALASALEVLAANVIEVMLSTNDEFTPTPAVSLAILKYNRGRSGSQLSDGIVITPSHNPPADGGFKYNPPNGGPANTDVTGWIQKRANDYLEKKNLGVKRMSYERALKVPTTHRYDFLTEYVRELEHIIDLPAIRNAKLRIGVDPLGGAGVHYWEAIADKYGLQLTVVNQKVDATFSFMPLDWDGRIRMDPSSSYAMQNLIALKDKFDISFGCDTDHDRHGIVTPSVGLLPSNHYLAVAVDYLARHRDQWSNVAVGKTVVTTQLIDRVAKSLQLALFEVPVGFKYFVDGLFNSTLGFAGEESAGASFLRIDGGRWTTDKDGIVAGLLAAEMTARLGQDPGTLYQTLTRKLGEPFANRIEAKATIEQKLRLAKLQLEQVKSKTLAGEKITQVITTAPGNHAPIGGLKVETENGWFAARPSGTEDIYKIYAESFKSEEHLKQITIEAQTLVDHSLGL